MTPEIFMNNFGFLAEGPNGIQKLRELILQLAVQGKLVPQDPNDEPVNELIQRIQNIKTECTNTTDIRINSANNDSTNINVLDGLPSSWTCSTVGKYTAVIMGQSPDSKYYNETGDGLPFFQGKAEFGSVYPIAKKWCTSPTKIALVNDVLISVRAPVGPTNICQQESCIGRGLAALRSLSDANHYYLMYYLRAIENAITSQGVGSTFKAISRKQIEGLVIPIPPKEEQKRIVEKVDQLMALCDDLEKNQNEKASIKTNLNKASLNALTSAGSKSGFQNAWQRITDHFDVLYDTPETVQELRQSILQLAVQGKLVPQDPNDESAGFAIENSKRNLKNIIENKGYRKSNVIDYDKSEQIDINLPIGWEVIRLGEIALIRGGKRIPKGMTFSDYPTNHIYIRVTDMKDGTIKTDKLKYIDDEVYSHISQYVIEKNDIYITIAGTIGEVGTVPGLFDKMNLTENAARIIFSDVNKYYFTYMLRSSLIQNQFIKKTNQQAQPKLALKRIASTFIPLPPLAEQKRIVKKVDQLMALCDDLEAKITLSNKNSERLMEAVVAQMVAQK